MWLANQIKGRRWGNKSFPQVRVGSYNVKAMYLITQMYSYNVIDIADGTGGAGVASAPQILGKNRSNPLFL